MNDEEKNSGQEKAPYEPPKLVRVSLRPEEAVLGHCKIIGTTGPVSGGCMSPSACYAVGS